jgi:hypothetical protein
MSTFRTKKQLIIGDFGAFYLIAWGNADRRSKYCIIVRYSSSFSRKLRNLKDARTCYRVAWFLEDSSSPLCRIVHPPGPLPVRTAGSRRSRIPAIPGPSPPSGSPPPPDKTPECASCRVGRPHRGRPARRRTQLRSRRGKRQDHGGERISLPEVGRFNE